MTISFRLSDLNVFFKALCTKGKNTMCMQTSCDWHSQYLYITMHLSCSMCFHTWVWVGYTLLGPVGWCHSLYSQRCHSTSASPAGKPPSSAPKSLPSRAKCTSHCQSQKPEPAENRERGVFSRAFISPLEGAKSHFKSYMLAYDFKTLF